MSKERFQSTGKTSLHGDYPYGRVVPRGDFLPSLIESDLSQGLNIDFVPPTGPTMIPRTTYSCRSTASAAPSISTVTERERRILTSESGWSPRHSPGTSSPYGAQAQSR